MLRTILYSFILILFFAMTSCAMHNAVAPENKSAVRIDIVTCACGGKSERAESVLKRVPGVIQVDMNYQRNIAKVFFDKTRTSVADMEAALFDADFIVGEVTAL